MTLAPIWQTWTHVRDHRGLSSGTGIGRERAGRQEDAVQHGAPGTRRAGPVPGRFRVHRPQEALHHQLLQTQVMVPVVEAQVVLLEAQELQEVLVDASLNGYKKGNVFLNTHCL